MLDLQFTLDTRVWGYKGIKLIELFHQLHIKNKSLTSTVRGVDDVVCIIHFSFNFIRDWQLSTVCRARDGINTSTLSLAQKAQPPCGQSALACSLEKKSANSNSCPFRRPQKPWPNTKQAFISTFPLFQSSTFSLWSLKFNARLMSLGTGCFIPQDSKVWTVLTGNWWPCLSFSDWFYGLYGGMTASRKGAFEHINVSKNRSPDFGVWPNTVNGCMIKRFTDCRDCVSGTGDTILLMLPVIWLTLHVPWNFTTSAFKSGQKKSWMIKL